MEKSGGSPKDSFGLICYQGDFYGNLGDDIQSLAALQFMERVDYYIPIDELGSFQCDDVRSSDQSVRVIVNGWFTSNPDSWPPSPKIKPLFISLHIADIVYSGYQKPGKYINIPATEVLLSPSSIEYLKQYEPIGCRDYPTMDRLKSRGVDAYFSGCLTLTLQPSSNPPVRENIYIIDAACEASTLLQNASPEVISRIRFHSNILSNAGNYSTHQRFEKAGELLKLYESASLVITSRLHCALPCLALGTPVIFILPERGLSRFPGLVNLMRTYSNDDIVNGRFSISWLDPEPNPVSISELSNNMSLRCMQFLKK